MFSGLISYSGFIRDLRAHPDGGMLLQIACEGVAREKPEQKDSIAIDGVCLTVTRLDGETIAFDVIPESVACTTLGQRRPGERVNVEYSLRIGDRMGGHFVYGHVDAALPVIARAREGCGERLRIARPSALAPMIAQKAFVAVDGISLTVAAIGSDWFEIALIPETLERTTLRDRPVGSSVNVEVDPLARYVHAAIAARREIERI